MTRPTNIQSALAETIAALTALRDWAIARLPAIELSEDNPADVDALAELAGAVARAVDLTFHEIAASGGVASRSGASPYAVMVQDAVDDNLVAELRLRAATLAMALDSCDVIDRREHGTLDTRTQGVGR